MLNFRLKATGNVLGGNVRIGEGRARRSIKIELRQPGSARSSITANFLQATIYYIGENRHTVHRDRVSEIHMDNYEKSKTTPNEEYRCFPKPSFSLVPIFKIIFIHKNNSPNYNHNYLFICPIIFIYNIHT